MIKNFLLSMAMIFIVGCSKEVNLDMMDIQNIMEVGGKFGFDYTITNTQDSDIWICVDMHAYSQHNVNFETRINNETVYINQKLSVPVNIMRDSAVVAKYQRLLPGESYNGKISIGLPVKNYSPLYKFHIDKPKKVTIRTIVFNVGFFEDFVKNINSSSVNKKTNNFIMIGHLFEKLNKEKTATAKIQNLAISGYIGPVR